MIKHIIKMIKVLVTTVSLCIFTFVILPIVSPAYGEGFLKVSGKSIVDSGGNNIILRGFGLGGWMLQEGYMLHMSGDPQWEIKRKITDLIGTERTEEFYQSWRANHCRKVDIDSLATWGFNSVRLPMHYNLFTLPVEEETVPGTNTWLETGFIMVDSLLHWCAENSMYLILDLHAAPGGQGYDKPISDYNPDKPSLWESSENRLKTVALWRRIATRYANEPWIGGYDLINEPNWDMSGNAPLKQLYQQITSAIRDVDKNHIIFIEGNWFANDFTGLTPPWDDNMVYSFHKYWSYNNQQSIQWVLDMRNTYNVPVWCGESGENSNVWFNEAIRLFENHNIGWAWWPLKKIDSRAGPLSAERSPDYQTLLNYWYHGGIRPGSDFAYEALMDLNDKLKIENCTYNRDVIDAMIRQVESNQTLPFAGNSIPGIINAADYDLGRNGAAYSDRDVANYSVSTGTYTAWNKGGVYRNDGVDIEISQDEFGYAYDVASTENGEWLKYTVNVTQTDSFLVKARVSSAAGGAGFKLLLNNTALTDEILINDTGGWKEWQTVQAGKVYLQSGSHELKLSVTSAGFNINQIEFIAQNNSGNLKHKKVELYQNYPNPFNPGTLIPFRLSENGRVRLNLYNANGQLVETLINESREAGYHEYEFNGYNLASGVYIYRINADGTTKSKRLILVR